MNDRQSLSDTAYAKLCALVDLCTERRATLYVIAYLTAGYTPDQFDTVLRTAMDFVDRDAKPLQVVEDQVVED